MTCFSKRYTEISHVVLVVKNLPANARDIRDAGSIPGSERSPGDGMATHSIFLAWRIPWIEQPGRLQSMGSPRVRHDWASEHTQWNLLQKEWKPFSEVGIQLENSMSARNSCGKPAFLEGKSILNLWILTSHITCW